MPDTLDEIYLDDLESYWQAVTVIEAQASLMAINVSCYPNMTKEGQRKMHKDLYRQAYPMHMRELKAITTDELAEIMKSRMG